MLVTLNLIKQFMKIPLEDFNDDDVLTLYGEAASDLVEKHCKRTFATATGLVKFDGDGTYELGNLDYPITAVNSLKIDDTTITSDYYKLYANEGRIVSDYMFTKGNQNVELDYARGYSTIPNDVQLATLITTSRLYEKRGRHALNSESNAGVSFGFTSEDIPIEAVKLLEDYVRAQSTSQGNRTFIHTI